jgi:hypothetical protein
MKSPKERFLETEAADKFREIAFSPVVIAAADAAMAQIIHDAPKGTDIGTAASLHFQFEGAKAFMRTFFAIADAPTKTPYVNPDSLPNE